MSYSLVKPSKENQRYYSSWEGREERKLRRAVGIRPGGSGSVEGLGLLYGDWEPVSV